MARTDTLNNFLTDVADAIREKKGTTDTFSASSFDSEIASIESGSGSEEYFNTEEKRTYGGITYYLKTMPIIDFSQYTSLDRYFYYWENLEELPVLNTSNITNFSNCFYGSGIKKFNYMDLSNATNVECFFQGCERLEEIVGMNCVKAPSFVNLCYACLKLKKVGPINADSCQRCSNIFGRCSEITDFAGLINLGKAYLTSQSANYADYKLDLSACRKLTHDSLMNIINNLYDIASVGVQPQQLVLGSTNLAKLTAEEIQIATNKGWSVS